MIPLVLALANDCIPSNSDGDDEAGGEPETAASDPSDQPGWDPGFQRVDGLTYPGFAEVPKDVEYVPWAPASFNVAAQPWSVGLGKVKDIPGVQEWEPKNPFYWEHLFNFDYNDNPLMGAVLGLVSPNWDALRSGLVGNYAVWPETGVVPEIHPRPPIVTHTLLGGDDDRDGYYNGYGQPCSSILNKPQMSHWGSPDYGTGSYDHQDCRNALYHYDVQPVSVKFPFGGNALNVRKASGDNAVCLDNGGSYRTVDYDDFGQPVGGADLTRKTKRRGLLWLNYDYAYDDWSTLSDEGVWGESELLALQDGASWPYSPTYRNAAWSHTGVCAYRVAVSVSPVDDCNGRTVVACPRNMIPILPEFSLVQLGHPYCDEYGQAQQIEGYCSFPTLADVGGEGQAPIDGLDIQTVDSDLGMPNAYKIGLGSASDREWLTLLDAIGFEDAIDGVIPHPLTETGDRLFARIGLAEGDVITDLDYGDASLSAPDAADLLTRLEERFAAGETLMLGVTTTDGRYRFVYLIPST